MLRGPVAAVQLCLAHAAAAAADAALTQEGSWAASGLFPGHPRRAAAIPWCRGGAAAHAAQEQALGAGHSAGGAPSGQTAPGAGRGAVGQSRRLFTCDVQSAGLSNGAFNLLGGLPAACSHADLGRLQAQISSWAERAGTAASPEERAAIVERLRRRLAERGLSRPAHGSLAALPGQLPGLLASTAWEANPIVAADVCDKLLEACARLAEAELAVQVAQSMRGLGIPVGYVAHGCVLRALCMAGAHEAALAYLAAEVPGGSQSTIMYNTILSSARHHGKAAISAKALDMMRENGVPRDAQTWVHVFHSLGSAEDIAAVLEQWQQMEEGTGSSISVRSAAVCALCACGRLQAAAGALQELLSLYAVAYGSNEEPSRSASVEGHTLDAGQETAQRRRPGLAGGKAQQTVSSVEEGTLDSWRDAERAAAQACHQVIHAAERARDADLAHQVVQAMHKAGVRADTAIYNSILRLVAADGGGPAGLEAVVAEMGVLGVRLDRRSYFLLLRAYGSDGDLSGAQSIMQRMLNDGISPDRYTFNALLEAHAAAGSLEGASKIYDAMAQRRIAPDICTFIALFQAVKAQGPLEAPAPAVAAAQDGGASLLYHMRGNARANAADLLHNWLQDFEASGVRHSPQSFTALVQALGHTCLIEPMLDLIQEAWNAPDLPRPSIYACNAAIAACARVGRLQEAMALYKEMESERLVADMYTYTSLIGGCAYTRQPELAYELFEQMREHGLRPSVYTYNALIKAECHVGNLSKALHLVDVMEDEGVTPDVATWGTLMSAARYLGQSEAAEMVLERMSGRRQEQMDWQQQAPISAQNMHGGQRAASEGLEDGMGATGGWDDDDDDDMFGGPRF